MAEVDSDEENQMKTEEESSVIGGKKPTYTKLTRDVSGRGSSSSSSKKQKIGTDEPGGENINPDEIEYEDDEEYYQKLMTAKENEKEDEMDMLRMQLQFEKEEAERKAKAGADAAAAAGGQPKTRIDADGTEYEWDPMVKGWFPKVNANFVFRNLKICSKFNREFYSIL